MKSLLRLPLAFLLVTLAAAVPSPAQDPVTTGMVEAVNPAAGTLTVRATQTQRSVIFYGVDQAMLVGAPGASPVLADLKEGMPVTVQYAERNKQWYVSKVIFKGEPAPAAPATIPTPGTTATAPLQTVAPQIVPSGVGMQKAPSNPDPNSAGRTDVQGPTGTGVIRNRSSGNAPR